MSHDTPSRRDVFMTGAAMAAGAGTMFGFSRTASAATDESKWITQIASFSIQDGKEKEAVDLLGKLTRAVEEKEPGVLTYVAHRYEKEPDKVVFYECFDSVETLKTHGAQPHLRAFGRRFVEVFKGPVDISRLNKVGGFTRQPKQSKESKGGK